MMEIKSYRVPHRPGEFLCDPSLPQWERVLASNRARVPGWEFRVLDISGEELRRQTRRRLWGESEQGMLILTGHQPVFFHAGVWIKSFVVRRAVAELSGASGYNVNVDSDQADLDVWLPGAGPDGLIRRRVTLRSGTALPLERQPIPTEDEWEAFARAGETVLSSLPEGTEREELLRRWRRFMAIGREERSKLAAAPTASFGLARFMASCRRRLEEEVSGLILGTQSIGAGADPTLGETYVSSVAETPEFARFALAWFADAQRLKGIYNDQLREYRRARRYRSDANPFPDLRRYGEQIEVPFWCADPSAGRADLFVIPSGDGRRLALSTRHGQLLDLDLTRPSRAVDVLLEADLQLRPKAVPLTMFLRMFGSDLFVHGVGGGRYDHITDGVIRAWWGVQPPVYAVVSASMPLDLPWSGRGDAERDAADPSHWKQRLWALRYNPQRFVDGEGGGGNPSGSDEELARLKAEKEQLIQAIGEPEAAKRELTRRIEAVNAALLDRLTGVESTLRAHLKRAEADARNREIALARDYPFFLHPPRALWDVSAGR